MHRIGWILSTAKLLYCRTSCRDTRLWQYRYSTVNIFDIEDCRIPLSQKQQIEVAKSVLCDYEIVDSPECISDYFKRLYHFRGDGLDKKKILGEFVHPEYNYAKVGKEFKIIEQDMATIFVGNTDEAKELMDAMQIDVERVKRASLHLKNSLELIRNAKSKDELRGYEGEAASIYFGVFNELILQQKKDFVFQVRNKRPPQDNINAMLSFVYTLLTNQIVSALEVVGLDPYIGYLHTDRPGRASLALDLIEEFRSVYADRFVLSLINKRIITGKDFSKKENGAVLLSDNARKKVLVEWQNKKKEVITHPYLKEKVEWGMVPYVQSMLLARYLRGDIDGYPVFLWK